MTKTQTMNNDRTIYSPDEAGDKQLVFDLISSMYGGIALMARAQQRMLNPDVVDLAKKLETAHTKQTEELKDLSGYTDSHIRKTVPLEDVEDADLVLLGDVLEVRRIVAFRSPLIQIALLLQIVFVALGASGGPERTEHDVGQVWRLIEHPLSSCRINQPLVEIEYVRLDDLLVTFSLVFLDD